MMIFIVLLESGQSLSLCFLAKQSENNGTIASSFWNDLWLSQPTIPDIPIWHLSLATAAATDENSAAIAADPVENAEGKQQNPVEKPAVLLLKLLWWVIMHNLCLINLFQESFHKPWRWHICNHFWGIPTLLG